jgi:hypothetical protein
MESAPDSPSTEASLDMLRRSVWAHELNRNILGACIEPPLRILRPVDAELERAREALALSLGAPLDYWTTLTSITAESALKLDTFGAAALFEMSMGFFRAHQAVEDAFLYALAIERPPGSPRPDKEVESYDRYVLTNAFLGHWEVAAMRLCGFWDRVGQLLDFVFFNIRQYEHDEFAKVIERIRENFVKPRPTAFAPCPSWEWLWQYQNSEQDTGYRWLKSRRNLVAHRLCMRDASMLGIENPLARISSNLLDVARVKLALGTVEDESRRLRAHHDAAAQGHWEAILLCRHAIDALGISPARLRV